jgi:hypothetical protein
VLPEDPHIAGNRDRRLRRLRRIVLFRQAVVRLAAQEFRQFLVREAHQVQFESALIERRQLHPKHLLVPPGIEG